MNKIKIVGAGLAGSEAALQLADAGWKVELYEMRPKVQTPAHSTGDFAELVCSNSLKSILISTASGLLKEELKLLDCRLLKFAEECAVPAGNALSVDRERFAAMVTKKILQHPNIQIIREEFTNLSDDLTIIASGPLTSDKLTESIIKLIGAEHLYFFDAIAPIVAAESIDENVIYRKTRYDKGEADYLNCPFTKTEYVSFVEALNNAEKHEAHEFETEYFSNLDFNFYQNCIPIEELARRGVDTLRFGVMRPVGLEVPESGKRPYAVIQLRAENKAASSFNLVGCQTMLKYGEQKKIFRKIPGLNNAEFLRFGSIHRNTFLNSPHILHRDLSLKKNRKIYLAGQLTGVEGYVESIFTGLFVARNLIFGYMELPEHTMSRKLIDHLTNANKNFQPMNANFGILPPLEEKIRNKKLKKTKLAERALAELKRFCN